VYYGRTEETEKEDFGDSMTLKEREEGGEKESWTLLDWAFAPASTRLRFDH
jgi:hypothetical protein